VTQRVRVVRATGEDLERVLEASELFDRAPDRGAIAALLSRDDLHLLIAYVDDRAAGFALAYELPRLDGGGPKLLLYEIGIAPTFRRRGIGRRLIEAMKEVGRTRGAQRMFVITEEANSAALALYSATGGVRRTTDEAVFEYRL
jgi:ribosomal protein S18 acetylase RimI-like enzyme